MNKLSNVKTNIYINKKKKNDELNLVLQIHIAFSH